ncbi:MAG TPA: caspase family protein [Polyangia bacterium]
MRARIWVRFVATVAAVLVSGQTSQAATEAPGVAPARFAIIMGVNRSVDRDVALLKYADDDAALFQNLFRALGARTYLLSRFDANTRRLHPQAVAEAQEPRVAGFAPLMDQVADDVRRARERGVPTVLYFVYAGHGKVADGRGYLALEDGRLFADDIERQVLDLVRADQAHIIVDACYSVFLALGRGPGAGQRREVRGFSALGGLASRADVGLLLSTSSARESHEWSEFQAGVFSHEVRSGLLGAADADGDGQVSYREIGAFVERANAPIPNEKFRPDVYVKEPSATKALLDLRPGLHRRVELTGERPGRYLLEDARGVRMADFHNASGQSLRLIRQAGDQRLFLRRSGDQHEYIVEPGVDVQRFGALQMQPASVAPRGAAHESFSLLFSLPFSQKVVDRFVLRRLPKERTLVDQTAAPSLRRPVATALLTAGAGFAVAGTWAVLSAMKLQKTTAVSQAERYELNQQIERRNSMARLFYGAGAAILSAGAALVLWPTQEGSPHAMTMMPTTDGFAVGIQRVF